MTSVTAPRVFLDTNIWFSAFWGSENCRKILLAHRDDKIKTIISHQVIEECARNFRSKLPQELSNFTNMLKSSPPLMVKDPELIEEKVINLIQKKDQPIFCSAMMAKVKYFVTGNIKDFSVNKLEVLTGIKIVTTSQLVKGLKL
ncbi:putative toxin-antitoxin system toxin component, PIN family [Candidatus Gottesmanbacteria bacterium RBG_16_37_8]|uniref:Putative toxin-antitoxin system toxin component, PIN family n=1 Tax=Candidatus Gottesmanbacteria bacterium RBG_16_37_8 TaxID=1798371 RepID=A0A1F5YWH5_9BACT|nr:MAG: putative toxin-antitoxin system toxin component, PIN family [Candidatus Gottesmanbacteria bacterium RBG_16_37_8]